MFHITCSHCGHGHLVGSRSIVAFENTNNGPVATVICPRGHTVMTDFGRTRVVAQPEVSSANAAPQRDENPRVDRACQAA